MLNNTLFNLKMVRLFYVANSVVFMTLQKNLPMVQAQLRQVRRADFDDLLAKQAQAYGADIRFGHEVLDVDVASEQPVLTRIR